MKLKGKIALITGAGKGIGYATALLFAKEGAKIIAVTKKMEDLRNLTRNIEGEDHLMISADLRKTRSVSQIVEKAMNKYGRVDILINNAGIYVENKDTFLKKDKRVYFDERAINELIAVNQLTPWMLSQEIINRMKKNIAIVNVASVNGLIGKSVSDLYDMTKAALIIATKNLARKYAEQNIRVNVVNPSSTITHMRDRAFAKYAPEKERKKADEEEAATIPLGRLGTTDDIAQAILFLSSDESSYITGEVLNVDGGYLLQPKFFFEEKL